MSVPRICEECYMPLQGRQMRFCGDKCRKRAERRNKTHEDGSGSTNSDATIPQHPANSDKCPTLANSDRVSVSDMTRVQLTQAIRAYPNDQWINTPEHKELMRRLHDMSPDELESEGYWVPAWKAIAA